jgi:arsenate reductase (thioredoxin)
MAAALLDHHAEGRVHMRSAGSDPADQINPAVVAAMAEWGIDLGREFPKPLTDEVVQAADAVVTMGCGDACAIYPASATSTGSWTTPPEAGRAGPRHPRRDRPPRPGAARRARPRPIRTGQNAAPSAGSLFLGCTSD